MSSLLKIATYFVCTLLLGALLAPPMFWAGHALATGHPSLRWLAETDFQRYFNRAMFLAALLLLWPAVRALRIRGWADLGLRRDALAWEHVGLGFGLAAGLLWALGFFYWSCGHYAPRPSFPWKALSSIVTAAVVVSLAEEGFFRGALQGLVRRTASEWVALVSVAALFAVLHFLKPPTGTVEAGEVGWLSGFTLLPKVFWQWGDVRLVLGGFATLFAVGLVLGWARLRTHSLWLPIGLHAGWVFGLKSFSKASKRIGEEGFWFGEDLLHGVAPVLVVGLTGVALWACLRREPRGSSALNAADDSPTRS